MITRLDSEVWAQDRCAGCAMCVATCSKQVLEWGQAEHPVLRPVTKRIGISKFELDTCSFCPHFCEEVCPRLEPAARMTAQAQFAARATGPLRGGEPNDVVRNLLIAARGAGLIDGALMVNADRAGHTHARIVTSAGEIAETTGMQYVWTPLLDALNDAVYVLGLQSLAIVGTPCTAQAVRRLIDSTAERLEAYRKVIRLNVALFCAGVYEPEGLGRLIADELRFAPGQPARISISPRKGKLYAQSWDGHVREMDWLTAQPFARAGCARCDDYLGESADIAVGSVGARESYSTIVVRTRSGQSAVQNALTMQLIETVNDINEGALWRAAAEKDRRERALEFDQLRVLILDALRDPRQHSEVKQQLDLLYGRPLAITKKEEHRNAGCGDCSGC